MPISNHGIGHRSNNRNIAAAAAAAAAVVTMLMPQTCMDTAEALCIYHN
jgi:hypothetical protein